jgi:TRAP-type mannitol/chloroaromatic compound transport system permease large subunit
VLTELRVRDLATIADVTLQLGSGLNVLTGETGAGKSMLVDALEGFALEPWGMLLAVLLILVLLGMIIDVVGLVVLTVPIFAPVIVGLGYDPLWFGILFNMTIQIGFLSPPFGYGMFYLKAVAPPDVSTLDLYRSVAPFIGLQELAMAIIMVFPPIATYLPSLMQ